MPEFPIPSLREFLVPDQLVKLRVFQAKTLEELEEQVNLWVNSTQSLIVVPGQLFITADSCSLALTYLPAVENTGG